MSQQHPNTPQPNTPQIQQKTATSSEVHAICTTFLASKIPEFNESQHMDTSFSALGLDSVSHVEFTGLLEEHFNLELDPSVGFNYPTLRSMAHFLNEQISQQTNKKKEPAAL